MARKKETRSGYGRLLDAWSPAENAGDPVGCVATSFTFSPVFFEEECLGRFLQLETNPTEDGALYLVEREEKLAQVACAAALVDQHYCQGGRSLRWDLLSARLPRGILHAKVSLLRWSQLIRVIVTSANLTDDGYRRNQEVFGVLDYRPGGQAPRTVLEQTVEFLRVAADYSQVGAVERAPALTRWNEFLDGVLDIPPDWGIETGTSRRGAVRVEFVASGPDTPDVLEQLTDAWPAGTPPYSAAVVSPFFDPPEATNEPARVLWQRLRRRGEASVAYYVTAEDVPGEDAVFLHAPESLLLAEPHGRSNVSTEVYRLELDVHRPLHAKTLWFEDDRWVTYTIGSSNFTSAGLGLGKTSNLEANLVYVVDAHRNRKAYSAIMKSRLDGKHIGAGVECRWQPRIDDGEDSASETVLLPMSFSAAIYDCDAKQRATISLMFAGNPPTGWSVRLDEDDTVLFTDARWATRGRPETAIVPWERDRPPSGFWVRWVGCDAAAWWPVNIATAAALPPPQELKDLPLEVLVDILTSARPLHRALKGHLRPGGGGDGDGNPGPIIDPHKRVDTHQFLLQRTRRVAWALNALRQRLEQPAVTEECLRWRLRGPVGVAAMASALERETGSPEEMAFLLSELALEMHRARPREAPGCIPASRVKDEIHKLVGELSERVPPIEADELDNLRHYVRAVFERLAT